MQMGGDVCGPFSTDYADTINRPEQQTFDDRLVPRTLGVFLERDAPTRYPHAGPLRALSMKNFHEKFSLTVDHTQE